MTPSVAAVTPATEAAWDAAWEACTYATYFHSSHWAKLWSAYSGGNIRPNGLHVTFSDGRAAILPLSFRRRAYTRVRECLSSPAATYGGWISEDDLTADHRALLAREIVARHPDLVWRLNPFDTCDFPLAEAGQHQDFTQALALEADFAAVSRTFTKGHRSAASKARRERVTAAASNSLDDWAAFQSVYRDSVRRWGNAASSVYDPKLFGLLALAPQVRLWVARHEDAVVAGAVCLYASQHVSYWLGGALEAAFPLRPVHLLMYAAIEDACRRGYAWFDFNPSGGHEGVASFKKGFGATQLGAPLMVAHGRRSRVASTVRGLLR